MQCRLPDGSVMVCGVLPRDAEYRTVGQNRSSLTKFSVKAGERPPAAEGAKPEAIWVSCQCWHAVARAASTLKKGDCAFCIGRIKEHTDPSSGKVYKDLVCEYVAPMVIVAADQPQSAVKPQTDFGECADVFNDGGVPF